MKFKMTHIILLALSTLPHFAHADDMECDRAFNQLMQYKHIWSHRVAKETTTAYCQSVANDAKAKAPNIPTACHKITIRQASPELQSSIAAIYMSNETPPPPNSETLYAVFSKERRSISEMFNQKCANLKRANAEQKSGSNGQSSAATAN